MYLWDGSLAVAAATEAPETVQCEVLPGDRVLCGERIFAIPEPPLGINDWEFWVYLGVYVFLVLFAGTCPLFLCSGW